MYTAVNKGGYVSEKAESNTGWLFPVGDEPGALGYVDMFTDMLNALDDGRSPRETFYDGYVVNAIIDAAYASMRSKQWQPVELPIWRGSGAAGDGGHLRDYDAEHVLIKEEKMMDGSTKLILRNKRTGQIVQRSQA
jgi:hypothetical protein